MSLVEDARPISKSSPSVCWKIRYSSRGDTAEIMPGNWRSSITAGQRHVQRSGTPQGEVAPQSRAFSTAHRRDGVTLIRCGASDDQDKLIGDAYPDAPSGSKPSCPRNSI
jgi:hypothetical protein